MKSVDQTTVYSNTSLMLRQREREREMGKTLPPPSYEPIRKEDRGPGMYGGKG